MNVKYITIQSKKVRQKTKNFVMHPDAFFPVSQAVIRGIGIAAKTANTGAKMSKKRIKSRFKALPKLSFGQNNS